MPRRGSPRTPVPVWSDGIHFVRFKTTSDDHPMPWFIGACRGTLAVMERHAETMDDALRIAMRATKAWLKDHPEERSLYKEALLPATSSIVGKRKQRGRPAGTKLPPFSTQHFNCIVANPYAQVWQCLSLPEERRPVGRKRADGSQPQQAAFAHAKGECAVLIGQEPVREEDKTVRVFGTWQAADEFALDLYENAPEDEIITWQPPGHNEASVVAATLHHEVHFDPFRNGVYRPFSLWNVTHSKPIFRDITKPADPIGNDRSRQRSLANLQQTNPGLAIQLEEKRRKERSLAERVSAFSETPLCFRSIWEAELEAERRDKMMKGIPV